MQNPLKQENDGLLFYLALLTGFFFLLEVSFFIQCNKAYLGDFTFVSNQIHIPWRIMPGIAYFIFAQLLLHTLFLFIVWSIAYFSAVALHLKGSARLQLALSTFALAVCWVIAANQLYFPNSRVIELTAMVFHQPMVVKAAMIFSASVLSLLALIGFIGVLRRYKAKTRWLSLPLLLALVLSYYFQRQPVIQPYTGASPNIIMVGVDSLRPDYLGHFGSDIQTPFMDNFLNHATVFTDSLTPLARTFPSWTGMLTGLYPKHVNVRTNLSDQSKANLAKALPQVLHEDGYQTIFGTDETRFSNISTAYGFQQLVTPPIGLNDFLLGTFNDFPLSNLVVNSGLGRILFPYSYANRPAYVTYDPESFLHLLKPVIVSSRHQPLFLAVHFCLPHSPYLWNQLSGYTTNGQARYAASVMRVDAQLNEFFAQLSQAGLLNNAIVVLLSDHGEALELPGDRVTEKSLFVHHQRDPMPVFYPPSVSKEAVNQSAGHGTDILGLTQYHTVLAVRLYGKATQAVGDRAGEVSTLDIMPTVLALAHLKIPNIDGVSLAPVVLGQVQQVPIRPIFVESDYSPQAIRTVYPETRKVFLEGIHLFSINNETTRLTVKPDMVNKIIHSKQVGIVAQGWMLALYPQKNGKRMPILVNLNNGEWTNDLGSRFALHSPEKGMMEKLTQFYGDELNHQSQG
jgi:arylsulfatase A-like enzyme